MSTIADRFPELTALHQEFMRALSEDPAPLADEAYLWHQGLDFERDPLKPSATSRGHEALAYLIGTWQRQNVPGQRFPKGQSPQELCGGLISRHAADWEGPYQINFRYKRNSEGIWSGFYTVETSAKHREIVAGRAPLDKQIAAAMKAGWTPETKERVLMYGNNEDPGAKVINRFKSGQRLRNGPHLAPKGPRCSAYVNF